MVSDNVIDLLDHFKIDPQLGFVLRKPLTRLPKQFEDWHKIVDQMPSLINTERLDEEVKKLPVISIESLITHRQLRLAHLLLTTIAAGYVWCFGVDKARTVLPKQIALPLLDVSHSVGLMPIIGHASACLANWTPIEGESDPSDASSVRLIGFKFSPSNENDWFFCVTAQVEVELGPAVAAIAAACMDQAVGPSTMSTIADSIDHATKATKRMFEKLSPDSFFHGLRLFLSGYMHKNFAKTGGIIYEGREDLGAEPLYGATAAQSPSFYTLDGFFGIAHHGFAAEFLDVQLKYLLVDHQKFIKWVREQSPKIVNVNKQDENYRRALIALRNYRLHHLELVDRYITRPAKGGTKTGTGGSSFLVMLNSILKDCSFSDDSNQAIQSEQIL